MVVVDLKGAIQQGLDELDFRSEEQTAVGLEQIQRFLPEAIAAQQ